MSGTLSDILAVAIGVVFVFLLLSLLVSWVQELIANLFNMRARNLADIMQNMLEPDAIKLNGRKRVDDAGLGELWKSGPLDNLAQKLSTNAVKVFYGHPVINSLSKPGGIPSYIPVKEFSISILDLLNKAGSDDPNAVEVTLQNINNGIDKLQYDPLKNRLKSLLQSAQINENKLEIDVACYRYTLESWFNASVARGSGWYKRRIQAIGIIIGILVAFVVNADTVGLTEALWRNAVLRDSISQSAVTYLQQGEEIKAKEAQATLQELGLPVGWSFKFADFDPTTPNDPRDFPVTPGGWVVKIVGILITGFAISQGSPIWFDLLNRLVNLRGSKPAAPAEAAPKAKET